MDWSIQEVARLAGTTSRTLRHYDDIGLLEPARIGSNGYRYYDRAALVRLQRILLLRELGLGLPAIAEVLDGQRDESRALAGHLEWLRQEQDRLARQVASVERTIEALEGGEQIMAKDMFDGFDHTQHRAEVERRWGGDAYARGDAWWRGLTEADRRDWKARSEELGQEWTRAAAEGLDPAGPEAQVLAARHVEWLAGIPGTPGHGQGRPPAAYVLGLADMYVEDPRFAASYGGEDGARFVRDALRTHVAGW